MDNNKILSINKDDRVLEIGPGGEPYPRSDVFLELEIADESISLAQRGYQQKLKTNKPVIYYNGNNFPFKDAEFDYVICSHVIEHVPDVEYFLKEMFRVAKRGYLAYPSIYYDYIYKINEHVNVLFKKGNTLYWMKQTEIGLDMFNKIRKFYHNATFKNYWVEGCQSLWTQEFEWNSPFHIVHADNWELLTYNDDELDNVLPAKEKIKPLEYKVYFRNEAKGLKLFFRKVICKLGKYLK